MIREEDLHNRSGPNDESLGRVAGRYRQKRRLSRAKRVALGSLGRCAAARLFKSEDAW
jgi:hypothetical protein